MPIVAIAGAVEGAMTIAGAVEAAGSVAGAFEAMSAMQMISAVGGIVGGIGAITGNKEMAMIGGVAALAGGLGSYAQGKGWIASDGPLADTSSNIAALKNSSSQVVQDAMNPTDMRLAAGTQTAPLAADAGNTSAVTNAIADTQGSQTSGLATATMGGPAESAQPVADAIANPDVNAKDTLLARNQVTSPASSAQSGGILGMFKDFSKWANDNKTLASIGANFIGGVFDSNKKAQTAYANARTDEINQQIRNMQSVPNMNLRSSGKVGFPTTAPTYQPVRVGLSMAR